MLINHIYKNIFKYTLINIISYMKSLINYVSEKLVINKNYKNAYTYFPKTFDELRKVIEDKYNKLGPGT